MTLEKQEVRILQPKISDENIDSFFYDSSIAHGIRSDGTAILLIANGEIHVIIDGKEYDNKSKEKAIKKYGLTDKKLAALAEDGRLIWKNHNWFQVIKTREGMGQWEFIANTVQYDYDSAIKIFNDCYNESTACGG